MITLEGYEIEEMRSINHIMTVELQFDRPVTQKEARDYLSRVLTKANEMEAQTEKEICKKIFDAEKPASESELAAAFGVPESVLDVMHETQLSADPIATSAKRIFEKTMEIAKTSKKLESTEPSKGVLKVPVTEEEIAGMKQKKIEEEAKAEKTKKIDWDKACALKKAGWSNKQIAEELHANEGTIGAMIYKHLEKYNAGERKVKYEEKTEV